MKRFSRREMALLLPVLALAGVAFYWSRQPTSQRVRPQGWFVEGKVERAPIFPVHSFTENGSDCRTRMEWKLEPGESAVPFKRGGEWRMNTRLVETGLDGRSLLLGNLNLFSNSNKKLLKLWRSGGVSQGVNGGVRSWEREDFFHLSAWNRPQNTLELRVDGVWLPSTVPQFKEADLKLIHQLARRPGAAPFSGRLILHRAGTPLPPQNFSRDALFDIKNTQFIRRPAKYYSDRQEIEVKWDVFWRGAPMEFSEDSPHLFSGFRLNWQTEKGALPTEGYKGSGIWGLKSNLKKGAPQRRFTIEFGFERDRLRQFAAQKGAKKAWLRGWISLGGAWPKPINMALPDWVLSGKNEPPIQSRN